MPGQIKAIRIIEIILGIIHLLVFAIIGLVLIFAGGFAGAAGQEGSAAAAGAGIGTGIFLLIVGVIPFLLALFAAKGLARKTNAGKILTVIVSILWLVPWGIIMLILLFSKDAKAWFEGGAA
jgi:hypothetical protein